MTIVNLCRYPGGYVDNGKKKLYFGFPINVFNTELERQLLLFIAGYFPEWELENPNQPHHQAGYEAEKALSKFGMYYFLEKVVPTCQGGVFLPFRDGRWGPGVRSEAAVLQRLSYPIWKISPEGAIKPILNLRNEPEALTVGETRQRLQLPY